MNKTAQEKEGCNFPSILIGSLIGRNTRKKPGIVVHTCNPALRRVKREEQEFEASLSGGQQAVWRVCQGRSREGVGREMDSLEASSVGKAVAKLLVTALWFSSLVLSLP